MVDDNQLEYGRFSHEKLGERRQEREKVGGFSAHNSPLLFTQVTT